MKTYVMGLLLFFVMACSPEQSPQATDTETASNVDSEFEKIMEAHWQHTLKTNPTFATSLGVRDYDDKLSDLSMAAYDSHIETLKDFVSQLSDVSVDQLSDNNALNHQLLLLDIQNEIEASKYNGKYMLLTNRGGPHLNLTRLPDQLPFFTLADYQSYVTRLGIAPDLLQQTTARLRNGLEAGWVQPCAPMAGYEDTIGTHLVSDANDSAFLAPFENKPSTITPEEFDGLRSKALEVVQNQVLPAFAQFRDFYRDEYAPACREEVGTSSMPGGMDYYEYRVRFFTTTQRTPDEVHNTGLEEVARIRAEMEQVMREAGHEGTFAEWLEYLRTNPDFYPKTAEERMRVVATISKKMDGELPKLFTRFPRMPYGLKRIPLDIAEKTTTAYYSPPAGDGSRAGFYYVNTTKLDTRPLHELEALTLHEAVPGHHFQIALAQELDMPAFRRFGGQTAFVEGWGLYSERLGLEVGFYQNPYTNFGRLSYEMWRACRLVVDTGLHAKGWTRQQAIEYMAENSGLSMNNIVTEVDRYITWPGQALAYKTGELKIRELRAKAEQTLGESFDVRRFHDAVLENGALPLSVLEQKIDEWLMAEQGS